DGIRDRNVTGVQTCALPISIPVMTSITSGAISTFPKPVFSLTFTKDCSLIFSLLFFIYFDDWIFFQEISVELSHFKYLMIYNSTMKVNGSFNSFYSKFIQCTFHYFYCFFSS